jgi:predicted nuclease with TOPRIM domain
VTGVVQTELHIIIQEDTLAINKEHLCNHIQEISNGLEALVQLPTMRRLNELLKAWQSVHTAEAQISTIVEELSLIQQQLKEVEGRIPECDHRDLEEKMSTLEGQLEAMAPKQTELAGELEDVLVHWK